MKCFHHNVFWQCLEDLPAILSGISAAILSDSPSTNTLILKFPWFSSYCFENNTFNDEESWALNRNLFVPLKQWSTN